MTGMLEKRNLMAVSVAAMLALSGPALAQSVAGTTTAADIEQAGYTNVAEVAPNYEDSVTAFNAIAPDGAEVTIEVQRGTGEWLVVRHQPREVVTIYPASEAPPEARPLPTTQPQAPSEAPM